MDQIKKQQELEEPDQQTGDDAEDESSSCGSFSGDELSEKDLRSVQGDILGSIKRFEELYNKKEKQSKERAEQHKPKKPSNKDCPTKADPDKKNVKNQNARISRCRRSICNHPSQCHSR